MWSNSLLLFFWGIISAGMLPVEGSPFYDSPDRPVSVVDARDNSVSVNAYRDSTTVDNQVRDCSTIISTDDLRDQIYEQAETSPELQSFLGEPLFRVQRIFRGRAGRSIVTAQDGTVLAIQRNRYRRSTDGGMTWGEIHEFGPGAGFGNAVLDETNGDILYVTPGQQALWRSRDHGRSWDRENIEMHPDGFGLTVSSVGAMQPGITLRFGEHQGRLIMPGRIMGPLGSNDVKWRAYHYSTAIYSDDGGATWITSKPFPVLGTGEAALAEISDASIIYNSREHMTAGNRFIARSFDGGETWLDAYRSPYLPDGPRGTSYGNMGGLIRLPVDGQDILLYSNLDTDAGVMPAEEGGTITRGREKITVWASFDGGKTWPVKRMVYEGPSAYSSLGVGRAGTSSEGKIYLMFEGGPTGRHTTVLFTVFNLSWLLEDIDEPGLATEPGDIYWTGMRDRWGGTPGGGSQNNWSLTPGGNDWINLQSEAVVNMHYDADRMTGNNLNVLMNRQYITVYKINITGAKKANRSGFVFDTTPGASDGIQLAGKVRAADGVHHFKNSGSATFDLAGEVGFYVSDNARLTWEITLEGKKGKLVKTGHGPLIFNLNGKPEHNVDIMISEGSFGGRFEMNGTLHFRAGTSLLFDKDRTLTVNGSVTFDDFCINDLEGLSSEVPAGTYQIIVGDVDFSATRNVGRSNPVFLDDGRQAYFNNRNGLQLTIR